MVESRKRLARKRRRETASELAALQEGGGCLSADERAERLEELADILFEFERELYPLNTEEARRL